MQRPNEAGDGRAEQRQEDDEPDGEIHGARAQPFITLMSSTAIVPRLRK